MRVSCRLLLVLPVLMLFDPASAQGQPVEGVGLRALGMGGAFVAVADDASATYWNPGGLATGPLFSVVVEKTRAAYEDQPLPQGAGTPGSATAWERQSGTLVAVGTLPLGVTFYRLTTASARVSAAAPVPPPESTGADLSVLRTTHLGVNVLQTLLPGVHIGSTLKYVRGSAGRAPVVPAPGEPLDAAGALDTRSSHAFDLDAGLIADLRRVRLGLVMRNVLEPAFDAPDGARLQLPRQVRAGVAVLPSDTLILSLDADLTSTPDQSGERRSLAVGAEQQLWQRRLALRGGVRVSTSGETRPVVTAGASVSLRSGIFADGYVAAGTGGPAPSGAGVGLRLVY